MYSAFLIQGLAAHLSAKRSALERLDRYRLRLRKAKEDLHHKEDKRRVVADALEKANAENKSLIGENKSLRTDLEVANKRAAKRECQLTAAEEKIKSLGPPNGNANLLRLRKLLPKLWRQRRSPPSKPATLFGWLSMSSGHGALGDDGMAFDFSEWMQDVAGSVVEVAGAYGDFCARSGGKDGVKTRLREHLERIAEAEAAAAADAGEDPKSSAAAAGREGEGNEAQDHPKV
uniref:Uncharacterized protein n=1 Tax=Oryza nivara TaxID=4536 RepID=A0A0E0GY88_ORYNI